MPHGVNWVASGDIYPDMKAMSTTFWHSTATA